MSSPLCREIAAATANHAATEKPIRPPAVPLNPAAATGAIVPGGSFRLPMVPAAQVADPGKIRLGGGFRLPATGTTA